jgi:hypothetical protein
MPTNPVLRKTVFIGGTIGAALDLAFALAFAAFNGLPPAGLLRLIASGLLGKPALAGGPATAALGLALHVLMSYAWAALFAIGFPAAVRRTPVLARRCIPAGCAFGVIVFLSMRLIVKPLSAFPFPVNWKPLSSALDLLSHMFLFGVPIAMAAARAQSSVRGNVREHPK